MSNFSPQTQCVDDSHSRFQLYGNLIASQNCYLLNRFPIPSEELDSSTSLTRHVLALDSLWRYFRDLYLCSELYLVLHVVFVAVRTESGASSYAPFFVIIDRGGGSSGGEG